MSKVQRAKDAFDGAKTLGQRKTLASALLQARREYYDFLTDADFIKEAEDLLTTYPEIKLKRESAAAA